MVEQHGEEHSAEEDHQEQREVDHFPVLGQFGLYRLQLPVLGEFVTFLRLHGFSLGEPACTSRK